MTPEQLGQKVKAQYPQYQNMSDGEVGQAVLQKYPQYQQVVSQPSQGSQQAGSNPIMDFLGAVSKPFRSTGQAAIDLGDSLGYGAIKGYAALGGPGGQRLSQGADRAMANMKPVLLSPEENQQALDHPVSTGVKAGLGVGSDLVPFGQGANLATKVLLPGALSGLLQSASQDNASPTSILEGILGGATGAGVMHGVGALLNTIHPNALKGLLTNGGTSAIASQYTPKGGLITKLDRNAIDTLATRYGLANISDVQNAANVAGDILHGKVTDAVSKAGPVDVSGIRDYTQQLLDHQGASVTDGQAKVLTNIVNKGLNATSGNPEDTVAGGNPKQVFKLIQALGSQADHYYEAHKLSGDQGALEYAQIATELENTLKDRLFGGLDSAGKQTGNGADQMLTEFSQPQLDTLHAIHPQLAQDAIGAPNVGAVRQLHSLFVKPSVLAERMSQKGTAPVTPQQQMTLGLSAILGHPLEGLAYVGGSKALNSNLGKSTYGETLINAGRMAGSVPQIPDGLQSLLDLLGAKTGSALSNRK